MQQRSRRPRVVVVGGGVSGLTAAYRLGGGGADVTLLEGTERLGGKLDASPVAGVPVDAGAESILIRRPEALDLVAELGLEDRLAYPAPAPPAIHSRGRLRSFPGGQVMGVPGDIAALARSGVLSWPGVLRVAAEPLLPPTRVRAGTDVPVGAYVGARMGPEVVDRLVEPLLGGVYAGRAGQLSLDATLPQIAAVARERRSLLAAVRELARAQGGPGSAGPAFATLRGGLATLVDALAKRADATIETSAPVHELRATAGSGDGDAWTLTAGPASAPRRLTADAVVLACPAPAAARLLASVSPEAARELDGVAYASMAIVTLAYPASAFPRPPAGSGFLVGAREGRVIKAVTFSSVKWPWLGEELRAANPQTEVVVARCSIGRVGDDAALRRSDTELAGLAERDLADICGVSAGPLERRVTRWDGGLPQYEVGHEKRVARARTAVARRYGLALCGAAYDGVGVPACVAGATSAARELLAGPLAGEGQRAGDTGQSTSNDPHGR